MKKNTAVENWSSKNVLEYYSTHRDSIEGLYESEKKYLSEILQHADNVLDIGCATGGFSQIVKKYKSTLSYTGVDISPAMIERAKKRFPEHMFRINEGERLFFADAAFDAVICFGVLHMTLQWKKLLAEAWRVCRNALLFDVRLTEGCTIADPSISYQKLEFGGAWDGLSTAPYIILNTYELISFLFALTPRAAYIKSYGYMHSVSPMTISQLNEVCMGVFLMEKKVDNSSNERETLEWGLPLSQPLSKNI